MSEQMSSLADVRQLLIDLRTRIRATFTGDVDGFRCSEALPIIDGAARGLDALTSIARRVDEWERKYPVSRIYSEEATRRIAKEMSDIVVDARAALAPASLTDNGKDGGR